MRKFLPLWLRVTLIILFYIFVGFMTFGYVENYRLTPTDRKREVSVVAGIFWPCYWLGRGWMGITDWSENIWKPTVLTAEAR